MKHYSIRNLLFSFALIFATAQGVQAAATLADAQKAYVGGRWAEAASLFEQVCPTVADTARTECELWNILALSQTGVRTDFNKAGKKLDALIQKTPKESLLYSELYMTRAQLLLYLGKYDKAAEALINAIEYSKPKQYLVLQKVCSAIQPKVYNPTLKEYCPRLSDSTAVFTPKVDTLQVDSAAVQPAAVQPAAAQPATTPQPAAVQPAAQPATTPQPAAAPQAAKPAAQPAPAPAQPAVPVQQPAPKPAAAQPAPKATPAPQPAAAPAPQPATQPAPAAPANGSWALQLGAFGVKSNADQLAAKMKNSGYNCIIVERPGETKTLYLVQIIGFTTKEQAIDFGNQYLTPQNVVFQPVSKK